MNFLIGGGREEAGREREEVERGREGEWVREEVEKEKKLSAFIFFSSCYTFKALKKVRRGAASRKLLSAEAMSGLILADLSRGSQRCRKRRRRRTAAEAAVLAVAVIAIVAVASAARSSSHVAPSSPASGASSSKFLSIDNSVSARFAASHVVKCRTKRARGYVRVFTFRVLQMLLSLSLAAMDR